MDIDELQTVQNKERQKDSLQHLRDSFYEDVAAYIEELKSDRERAAEETTDPFSDPEVSRLTDDIERAEDVVEAVYERRVGKVVKMASFAAADMPVQEEGLTTQERDLFEDMVGRIGDNRSRVLDILAGDGDERPASTSGAAPNSQPTSESVSSPPADTEPTASESPNTSEAPAHSEPAVGTGVPDPETEPSAVPPEAPSEDRNETAEKSPPAPPEEPTRSDGGVSAETSTRSAADADEPTPSDNEARTTVRITADVGRMLGVDDREYELKREDVVSLPEDNADALLQREAAERLW